VIEAIQLFVRGHAHLPVLVRMRDVEVGPHALRKGLTGTAGRD
jgi:hypothetical protein